MTSDLAVFQNIISSEPQVEPMQNAYWKKDSASHQKSPEALCKASEDVG
jgi:hypothetical protein